MKYCTKCGKELKKDDKFCGHCGEKVGATNKKDTSTSEEFVDKIGDSVEKILDTQDDTKKYKKDDIENNKGLAALSYIGPLALIPYFGNKESKYVKYHAVQGMNLLIIWIIYWIVFALFHLIKVTDACTIVNNGTMINCIHKTPSIITIPLDIIGLFIFALSIIGFVFALIGKAKKVPLLDKVNIIKE